MTEGKKKCQLSNAKAKQIDSFHHLSENNVAFDNSCLVPSSRREDDNDRKRPRNEHEVEKMERDGKTRASFASLSAIQGVRVLNGQAIYESPFRYYIHIFYRNR